MARPIRRGRASVPNTALGLEEVSTLSLAEVRARLERNSRVLNTSLFSTSPTASPILATSPTSPAPPDPFRDKLLVARQQLLDREQELLAQRIDGLSVNESPKAESSAAAARRGSGTPNMNSGKARALEAIQANERLSPSTVILPYHTTAALAERDFDNATAQRLASMSLVPETPTKRPPTNLAYDPNDEIARAQATARMQAFMTYKGEPDDDDFLDEGWGMEGDYDGEDDEFRLEAQGREPHRHARGTGEEVDQMGEDDEEWAEGAEEYFDRVRDG